MTLLADATGTGLLSTSFVKTLGKTLCLCLVAVAMDVVWGYCGILSLGHMAFFGLGGYAIGMWLMYARTEIIVMGSLSSAAIPPTPQEIDGRHRQQIFGVVGAIGLSAGSGPLPTASSCSLLMVVLVPGLLALVFGWLAFRSRVTGVYLSILTQAMTLALSLYLFQNDSGLRGNNGLSGLQNIPGFERTCRRASMSIVFFWASALALALGYLLFAWVVSGKMGSVVRGIRDNEARVRFLGYHVESYKLFVFTLTAIVAGIAGALYYPQAGIINPAEIAPIASIYLAVWVAIGGRGRLYGAAIGAACVSLLSRWFTGGGAPDIDLGFYEIQWTDWWLVLLGLSLRRRDALLRPRASAGCSTCLPNVARRRAPATSAPTRARCARRRRRMKMRALPRSAVRRETRDPARMSGVSVSFDGFSAINNLSFQIGEPELRAVIGPNGAGKTTFMDIVTGKTRPDEGRVIWGEHNRVAARMSESQHRPRRASAASSRSPPCSRRRRSREPRHGAEGTRAARSPCCSAARPTTEARADRGDRHRDRPDRAPHPHRRRAQPRAEAMAGDRDAAGAGSAPAAGGRTRRRDDPGRARTHHGPSEALPRATRVVVVEHDMEFVRRLDCKVTVLHEGSVLAEGSLDHVTTNPDVIDVYLGR